MNWSKSWGDKPEIIDAGDGKTFVEQVKETVQKGDDVIKNYEPGDGTIISIYEGDKLLVIGENIELAIPVANSWNDIKVKAIKILDLAIIISGDPEDHCVAHIPTQTWFDNAVPDGEWTPDQLMLWAWRVQNNWPHLFGTITQYTNKTYKNIAKPYLDDLKEKCLNAKVIEDGKKLSTRGGW